MTTPTTPTAPVSSVTSVASVPTLPPEVIRDLGLGLLTALVCARVAQDPDGEWVSVSTES